MQSNQEILKAYEYYKTKINPVSKISRKTILNRIKRLGFIPYRDLTEDDIIKYMEKLKPSTRNSYLITIKTFMKWLYDEDDLPPCVKRIKPIKIKHNEIRYRERIVTEIEYNRLLYSAATPKHKAILEILYWLGVRAGELLSINSDGVTFDGDFTRVIVRDSKTEPREIVHKGRLEHLLTYVETYQPNKGKIGLPLFVGHHKKRLTYSGIEHFIDKLSKKLGLKNITLHDFRHTSISRDRANGVPITHIETKHGLEHGSQVIKIYDHNKTKDYENYLKGEGGKVEPTYEEMKNLYDTKMKNQEQRINDLESTLSDAIKTIKAYNDFFYKDMDKK